MTLTKQTFKAQNKLHIEMISFTKNIFAKIITFLVKWIQFISKDVLGILIKIVFLLIKLQLKKTVFFQNKE